MFNRMTCSLMAGHRSPLMFVSLPLSPGDFLVLSFSAVQPFRCFGPGVEGRNAYEKTSAHRISDIDNMLFKYQ